VWANGYERFRKPVDALPGAIQDLGTIALAKEVTVEGRVIDLEGYPLAASFALGSLEPGRQAVRWFRHEGFESSRDGTLKIRGLGRGEYVFRTSNHDGVDQGAWEGTPWVSGNHYLDTRTGSITGLEVVLRPAAGLVLQAAAGAGDRARFAVVDALGLELVGSRLHGSEPRLLQLPAGCYRVALLDLHGAVLSQRSVTLGSETIALELAR